MKVVSVLIPTYNVEEFVEEAVTSIIHQTYSNLEIIIVDDGSTDKTFKILTSLKNRDNRIRLFKNSQNKKIVKTLNHALSKANGKYIARMDGDDISESDRIQRKVEFLEKNREYDLVGCSVKSIDETGRIYGKTVYEKEFKLLKKNLKYRSPVSHIWVARREVYKTLNGYRRLSGCEDYDFLLRMVTKGYKFTNLQNYFGYYVRIRDGNTIDWLGLRQLKMHDYVNQLYRERVNKGTDSLSQKNLQEYLETNKVYEKLFNYSSKKLRQAIRAKSKKKYLKSTFFSLLSLVSPHQQKYLSRRIANRFYRKISNNT